MAAYSTLAVAVVADPTTKNQTGEIFDARIPAAMLHTTPLRSDDILNPRVREMSCSLTRMDQEDSATAKDVSLTQQTGNVLQHVPSTQ
jgi:hypothetical protein